MLSLKEAARLIGYSESGMRKLIAKRAIKYAKPGGRYKFRTEWLDEFIAKGTVVTREEVVAPKPKRKAKAVHRHGFDSRFFNL